MSRCQFFAVYPPMLNREVTMNACVKAIWWISHSISVGTEIFLTVFRSEESHNRIVLSIVYLLWPVKQFPLRLFHIWHHLLCHSVEWCIGGLASSQVRIDKTFFCDWRRTWFRVVDSTPQNRHKTNKLRVYVSDSVGYQTRMDFGTIAMNGNY